VNQPRTIKTRKVALLALAGVRLAEFDAVSGALCGLGVKVEVVSTALGPMKSDGKRPIDVQKTFLTTASVLYDAVLVLGGAGAVELAKNADAIHFVRESFRHAKPIGAVNEGISVLAAADLPGIDLAGKSGKAVVVSSGVVSARTKELMPFNQALVAAIRAHRHFDRKLNAVPA
jgi:catalase